MKVSLQTSQFKDHKVTDLTYKRGFNFASQRDISNVNSKRTSRCSNQPKKILTQFPSQSHLVTQQIQSQQKQSLSNRRSSDIKHMSSHPLMAYIINCSKMQNKISQDNTVKKSFQQNSIKQLLNNKSQAYIKTDSSRQSSQPQITSSCSHFQDQQEIQAKNSKNLKKQEGYLSVCSSQVQLKERPYQKFLNPESKQFFTAFTKNLQNPVAKSTVPSIQTQSKSISNNEEEFIIKVISPNNQIIHTQQKPNNNIISSPYPHEKKAAQTASQQYMKLKILSQNQLQIKQRSKNSTSCEVPYPQLLNISNNPSQCRNEYQIPHPQNSNSITKFQKFQARKPNKGQNYSLIERALLKKPQITTIMKQFETNQVVNTLDNTCETTFEDRQSNNGTFCGAILRNISVSNSDFMMPMILSYQQTCARNIRVSHTKSPLQQK